MCLGVPGKVLEMWDDDTGITITLATRKGIVGLHQQRDGERVSSTRSAYPIAEGEVIDLQMRSDGFELELSQFFVAWNDTGGNEAGIGLECHLVVLGEF